MAEAPDRQQEILDALKRIEERLAPPVPWTSPAYPFITHPVYPRVPAYPPHWWYSPPYRWFTEMAHFSPYHLFTETAHSSP